MVKKLHIVLMTIVICLTFVYGVKIKNATAQKVNYIVVLDVDKLDELTIIDREEGKIINVSNYNF